jgi:pimeloyl-ACP methyl ester carboxylesterase
MNVLIGIVIAIAGLPVIGFVYQILTTQRDKRRFPPPGRLVDVGGFRLHLYATGKDTGKPSVILDEGMASFSSNFAWVQQELESLTRVVSYDRAGLGWSDSGPKPLDAQRSARQLHTALENARIAPPYVVAGHSYGGLVMRAFADLYPGEVAGMVLIDASHPDQWIHIPVSKNGRTVAFATRMTGFLAHFGLLRFWNPESALIEGLPAQQRAEMDAFLATPRQWSTGADGLIAWGDLSRDQINGARSLGDMPLFVLSVTEQDRYADVLTALQAELPKLSSNSLHLTVQGATHDGLVCRREHALVVADAIRQVVEAASTRQPLRPQPAGALMTSVT